MINGNHKVGGVHMNKNKQVDRFFLLMRSLLTGFISGLLWGSIWIVMYYFNFTEVTPKTFILSPWRNISWTQGWLGNLICIIILATLSVVMAFIYYVLFKKLPSIWVGVFYGCIIWVIFFVGVQPLFSHVKQLAEFSKETIVTTISVFVLYGTFIGYSISFDYYDTFIAGKKIQDKEL